MTVISRSNGALASVTVITGCTNL